MAQSVRYLRAITTADFYSKAGAVLMARQNYSKAIRNHLYGEKECVKSIVRQCNYTAAVEVGCADGSVHMQTLLALRLHYLGIDLVPRFISILNQRLDALSPAVAARAVVLDAHCMSSLLPLLQGQAALLIFAFNSFGNVDDPNQVIAQASACRSDFLILTYRTNRKASLLRHEYYSRCNLSGLRHERNERGVVFRSDDGLHSYAYHHAWLTGLFRRHSLRFSVKEFGMLGRLYWCRPSREQ
jgi:hypothetical protein